MLCSFISEVRQIELRKFTQAMELNTIKVTYHIDAWTFGIRMKKKSRVMLKSAVGLQLDSGNTQLD